MASTKKSKSSLTPGQQIALRGCVARRPWHPELQQVAEAVYDLVDLVDLARLAKRLPAVKTLLGDEFEVTMAVTPSGRGVVVAFEPLDSPSPRRRKQS